VALTSFGNKLSKFIDKFAKHHPSRGHLIKRGYVPFDQSVAPKPCEIHLRKGHMRCVLFV